MPTDPFGREPRPESTVSGVMPTLAAPIANPFATRFVRPGAIAYCYAQGESREAMLMRWERLGHRGAIVGPHGSGKTTLLRDFHRSLVTDHQEAGWFRASPAKASRTQVESILESDCRFVMLDSYEALPGWQRRLLSTELRRRGRGLLVTVHRRGLLPVVARLRPRVERFLQLIEILLREHGCRVAGTVCHRDAFQVARWQRAWPPSSLRRLFRHHEGDFRESLFALYDSWEALAGQSV